MLDCAEISRNLVQRLHLTLSPVAVCLADELPAGVKSCAGPVPAGCVFWQEALQRVIGTSAADHDLCAIGVHTHHLRDSASASSSELSQALAIMADLSYVTADEVTRIPVIPREVRHVVYAPLAQTPLPPDVVLLFADARQGLVLAEAAQRLDGAAPPALGRPACALVPHVLNSGRAALSLGCCGARAYLDVLADGVALWGFPGGRLAAYAGQVSDLALANAELTRFHALRRDDVRAGSRPTVGESLARVNSTPADRGGRATTATGR